jgi:hypothetical protein
MNEPFDIKAYDAVAHEYYDSALHPTCWNFREASAKLIQTLVSKHKVGEGVVCDVGAGDSVIAELGKKHGISFERLILVDSSVQMLRYSKRFSGSTISFVVSDARALPFHAGSIRWMISSLGDPYNDLEFWKQVTTVLSAEGYCYFTTPSYEWASSFREGSGSERANYAMFDLRSSKRVYMPSNVLPSDDQIGLIQDQGLIVEEVRHVTVGMLSSPLSPKLTVAEQIAAPIVTGYLVRKP